MRLETKDVATLLLWIVATSVGGYALTFAVTIARMLVFARRLDGSLHFILHGRYVVMPLGHAIGGLVVSSLICIVIFFLLAKNAAA
jgi:hypothetical protein